MNTAETGRGTGLEVLRWQFGRTWSLAEYHLPALTDEACPWRPALDELTEDDLRRPLAYPWQDPQPLGLAVAWANSELMKNIAEIGNVRLQHVARDAGDESDPVATTKFSVKPTLTGQRVILRPFRDEDFGAMKAAVSDPEVQRLTGAAHSATSETPSEDVTRRWYATRNAQNDRLDLAVVDKATGETVGEVVLNEWDAANNSCSFRTLIGPRGRVRGLGTEAIRLVIGYGFEELGMHRISLEVYAFNPRARHVYEKVGFVEEGVLREALRYEDEWVDASVMSILASEWEQHRDRR